jgi:hypothetical protein
VFYTEEEVIDTDGQILTKTTYKSGNVEYRNTEGQLHRIGGPALIYPDDTRSYWVNGKGHRTDGPAIIWWNGYQQYYVDDIEYTQDEYPQAVLNYKLKQLVG